MNLPIEVIGLLFLFFLFIFWLIYKKLSYWIIAKKYKPENDKSRKGEEQRRTTERIDKPITEPVEDVPEPSGLEGRGNLQIVEAESNGKNSHRFRGIFKRTRRK